MSSEQRIKLRVNGKLYEKTVPVRLSLADFLRDRLVTARTIDAADVDRFRLTDSPEEAAEYVRDTALKRFGLTAGPRMRRRWWPLER